MKHWGPVLLVAASLGGAPPASAAVVSGEAVVTLNTISVEGTGRAPIAPAAASAEANAAYHQALTAAAADGLEKARSLASATGAKVGPVEAISERGGSIVCKSTTDERESGGYKGVEPDFGKGEEPIIAVAVPAPAPARTVAPVAAKPSTKKKHKKHRTRKAIARKAEVASCEVVGELALIYALET